MDEGTAVENEEQSLAADSAVSDGTSLSTMSDGKKQESTDAAWICIVGDELKDDEEVQKSAKVLNLSIAYTNEPAIPDCVPSGCNLAFICTEFEGPIFDKLSSRVRTLKSSSVRILGPPCLHNCAARKMALPLSRRPMFSLTMFGTSICFMGFKASERSTMDSLVAMVQLMGAAVRKDISDASHVVSQGVTSSRYERAVAFGKCIMSTEWIRESWKHRHSIKIHATDDDMMHHRLPPFTDLTLSFFGFDDEDRSQMEDFCQQYGGKAVPYGEVCTHVVCAADVTQPPLDLRQSSLAVKMEWFWESIQIRACSNVNLHRFDTPLMSSPLPGISALGNRRRTTGLSTPTTPSVLARTPKAERDVSKASAIEDDGIRPEDSTLKKKQIQRRNQCLELQDTEENYVTILKYIVDEFVKPLEMTDQLGGAILKPEEVKEIFYPLPQLAALHEKLLAGLNDRFSPTSFDQSVCFGDVLLAHVEEMIRIYPRFINFYEARQECVVKKSRSNPRFTAFVQLRYAQAAKSGGAFAKQKLQELLIAPVQRMPRYLMLLQGVIKLTDDSHKDKAQLIKALEGFKQAAQRINEDKRIAERRIAILNLPNIIESLPPTVLNSSRNITSVVNNLILLEVLEGEDMEMPVSIVVFNDSVEIAKRRGGREAIAMEELTGTTANNSSGGGSSTNTSTGSSMRKKPLRHIDFLLMSEIKRILHFQSADTSAKTNLLGLEVICAQAQEQWIILRVLPTASQSLLSSLNGITTALTQARETSVPGDASSFVQIVSTEVLPFPYDGNVTDAARTPTSGIGKAIKEARHKAKKVTRAFSHQVQRLENFTPRRTGLRRSYAPPPSSASRRHVALDSMSCRGIPESPSTLSVTPSTSMTSMNSVGDKDRLPSTAGITPSSSYTGSAQGLRPGPLAEIPAIVTSHCDESTPPPPPPLTPTKRSNECNGDNDEEEENCSPSDKSGSLKRKKENDEGGIPKSSSITEFQQLPLTFL